MALIEMPLTVFNERPPRSIREFLEEADARIQAWYRTREGRAGGFVPSDFLPVYHALNALVDADLAAGNMFCEWVSGFGVVAMLAAHFEFDAYGIEIDGTLVEAARQLSDEFSLPAQFVQGSFIPAGGEAHVEHIGSGEVSWLTPEVDMAYSELGLTPQDFDVIYAFPWPGEEDVITRLFDDFASVNAILLTYSQLEGIRIRRKVLKRRQR